MRRNQQGYYLILAVILVMVIGVMGVIMASTYATRARISVAQQQGLQTFYIAEAGLEVASRLLVGTSLVSGQGLTCATLTGASLVTNASMLGGTFTATAVGGGLYTASTTLSAPITASSNSLTVASATGMAAHGRVRIDSEAIDYASLSGTTLTGLNRGVASTTAASHAAGASVSESVCLVSVSAGIPSIASPSYQRQLEMAVEILSSANVWAVGARHGNQFSIARWNTPTVGVWNDVSPPTDSTNREDLNAISMSSTTYGWAVGVYKSPNFTMVRWNGTSWAAAPFAGACNNQNLTGVAVTSTTEAWAVGNQYRTSCASSGSTNWNVAILKWNGTTWTKLTSATSPSIPAAGTSAANPTLNAVSIFDSNNDGAADYGFAVGNGGVILRYTGSSWVSSASGVTNNLLGVDVVSGSEAWAVGAGGTILKWNGATWSTVSSPTSNQLNAVSMIDTNNDGVAEAGWAVGNTGTTIYYNGSTWATQTSGTSSALTSVAALSSSSALAGGAGNTMRQYTGGAWAAATPPAGFSVAYNGMASVGGGPTITGSQVGSWKQIFR